MKRRKNKKAKAARAKAIARAKAKAKAAKTPSETQIRVEELKRAKANAVARRRRTKSTRARSIKDDDHQDDDDTSQGEDLVYALTLKAYHHLTKLKECLGHRLFQPVLSSPSSTGSTGRDQVVHPLDLKSMRRELERCLGLLHPSSALPFHLPSTSLLAARATYLSLWAPPPPALSCKAAVEKDRLLARRPQHEPKQQQQQQQPIESDSGSRQAQRRLIQTLL
jgi:hypothetical protein